MSRPQLALMLFIILFAAALVSQWSELIFWTSPPPKKFALSTRSDLDGLAKNHFLPSSWSSIRNLELSSDASHVQDWLDQNAFQISKKKDGNFTLQVFVSEWIDGYRYGALVRYDLIDIKTKNTVWELNRTYKLGILY